MARGAIPAPGFHLAAVELKVSLNRAHVRADASAVVFLAVDVVPPAKPRRSAVQPLNICIAVDCSTSMTGQKIEQARASALGVARELEADDTLSVVAFTGRSRVVLPPTRAGDTAAIKAAVEGLTAKGETNLEGALKAAHKQLMRAPRGPATVSRILLLTDGKPTRGRKAPEQFERLAAAVRKTGATVTALGIGPDYNDELLVAIAQSTGGMWHHIVDPSRDLKPLMQDQVAQMNKTLVRAPKLQVTLFPGARVLQAFAVIPMLSELPLPPFQEHGVELPLGDIVAGASQTVSMRVRVPPVAKGRHALASVALGEVKSKLEFDATEDAALFGTETNPYPRLLLTTAEGTVIARNAIVTGDNSEIGRSETILRVVGSDPASQATQAAAPAVAGLVATLEQSQRALNAGVATEGERKRLAHDATIIKTSGGD